jgi:mannose-1-phosphate guanylyltransferase/mannose-1-phosphate guanylyltransferase/mannose-6-phosphate isomerase
MQLGEVMLKPITPVILSGGAGTRLWPLSRADRPKQLIALSGEQTMLQQTALRTANRHRYNTPFVVANAEHASAIEAQLKGVAASPAMLILEPVGRNTAAAIALAALSADPTDLLLVMPSDHLIGNLEAFEAAVATAVPLACENMLVTFGIEPDRPEVGYGYIQRGTPLNGGAFKVKRFVEKPGLRTAEAYLRDGGYDWNGGIFLFRAEVFLDALGEHEPAVLSAARAALAAQRRDGVRCYPDARCFSRAPSISIDNAVLEKSTQVAVVPVEMDWSDVGTWEALHELGAKDTVENVIDGQAIALDTRGCLIRSEGPLIVSIGVEDLVIVATKDAVLVVPRGSSQRVREALQKLEG